MRRIVECVPNFSEGRDPNIVEQIVRVIASVPGAFILDQEMDPSHNRCVITFAGEPESVTKAVVAAVGKACELIDLRTHKGEHPRIGATDVIPFIPISGVNMLDCVRLAERVGQEIAERYNIPVYLYEEAARIPQRRDLAYIRKGDFEGLRQEIETNPERKPDFGEAKIHPTAGATVVGARPALIAYNVYLNTSHVEVAKNIAKAVRYSGGGLRYVKGLGFEIKERHQAQVSMNLTNYEGTPIFRAFEMVKREAERYGATAASSELVGLVPQKALNQCAEFYLQLEKFSEDQVLENRLVATITPEPSEEAGPRDRRIKDFVEGVAKSDATPGGGSVAALAGTLGAALGKMVCGLTIGKKKYVAMESQVREISQRVDRLKDRLFELVEEDSRAFEAVVAAYALPKTDEGERKTKIEQSLERATEVPLNTAESALDVLKLLQQLLPICNRNALSDLGVGALMAHAAVKGAAYNVYINLSALSNEPFKKEAWDRILRVINDAAAASAEVEQMINRSLGV